MRGTVFPYRPLRRQILAVAMGGAVIALCLIFMGSPAYAGEVVVASYEGVINPVAAEYLHDALVLPTRRPRLSSSNSIRPEAWTPPCA